MDADSFLAELWVTPSGRMYYRMHGWNYYVIVPDDDLESDTTLRMCDEQRHR